MSCRRRELTTMRLTAQGSKPMRLTALRRTTEMAQGSKPLKPMRLTAQGSKPCCAEGGHHQAMAAFVYAWRDRVVGVSVRPQMDAIKS